MRFAPDFLDEIRSRLPISSVVGTRVAFDRKKSNASRGDFWACCPFHGEKTPSFHCDDGRGRYHCFGCGVSGDHFRFLTELEGISFPEAVERLATQAGLAMPARDEKAEKEAEKRQSLYDIMELAADFFSSQLSKKRGGDARHYLHARDVSSALMQDFRLGFAPDSRNGLKEYLVSKGIGLELMARCGLIVSGEDVAVPYDRFRNRIIFPILDRKGRVIGFGGRAMAAGARAKYLNSPETDLFHKGELLYNLARARASLQEKTRGRRGQPRDAGARDISALPEAALPDPALIVVEGYMDVIALAKAGFSHAVAPLGTALTDAQLQLLWQTSKLPILCFDGDEAGVNAAYRALERALPLLKPGQSLQFVLLPAGKDPDDIVREGGGEALSSLLREARPLVDMLMLRETQKFELNTPEARALLERNLRQAAFMIGDESLRHYYLQELRTRARALFRPTFQQNQKKGGYGKGARQESQGGGFSPELAASNMVKADVFVVSPREAAIAAMFINHPVLLHDYFEQFSRLEFDNAQMRDLHQAMLDILALWQVDDGHAMRKLLSERGQGKILDEIDKLLRGLGMRSAFIQAPFEDVKAALKQALHLHFHAHNLHKRLSEIEQDLVSHPDVDMLAVLRDVRLELERTNATEALIDGFGNWQAELRDI